MTYLTNCQFTCLEALAGMFLPPNAILSHLDVMFNPLRHLNLVDLNLHKFLDVRDMSFPSSFYGAL